MPTGYHTPSEKRVRNFYDLNYIDTFGELKNLGPLLTIVLAHSLRLPFSCFHALHGGVMRDDFMKVEEYPGKVRDEESDDDCDKDHRHFVLGPPPFHVGGLLMREACRSVFAEGKETDDLKRLMWIIHHSALQVVK